MHDHGNCERCDAIEAERDALRAQIQLANVDAANREAEANDLRAQLAAAQRVPEDAELDALATRLLAAEGRRRPDGTVWVKVHRPELVTLLNAITARPMRRCAMPSEAIEALLRACDAMEHEASCAFTVGCECDCRVRELDQYAAAVRAELARELRSDGQSQVVELLREILKTNQEMLDQLKEIKGEEYHD